ncbi:MAG: hypothetical protein RL556_157 [Actinomycetota bacterium]
MKKFRFRALHQDRGSATAELAILIPVAMTLVLGLLAVSSAQLDRVKLIQAASVAVRAASHLEPVTNVKVIIEKIAPGSKFSIESDAEVICAKVSKVELVVELSEKFCSRVQGM